jgi:hypothetical protein
MKTVKLFPSLFLIGALLFLSSCASYEAALFPAASSNAAHPMWGIYGQNDKCPHRENYMGGTIGTYPFSMRNDYFNYCHKCGRYVRGRQ